MKIYEYETEDISKKIGNDAEIYFCRNARTSNLSLQKIEDYRNSEHPNLAPELSIIKQDQTHYSTPSDIPNLVKKAIRRLK